MLNFHEKRQYLLLFNEEKERARIALNKNCKIIKMKDKEKFIDMTMIFIESFKKCLLKRD